jgi:hypothetical protein
MHGTNCSHVAELKSNRLSSATGIQQKDDLYASTEFSKFFKRTRSAHPL